jgi:hypothetical protein
MHRAGVFDLRRAFRWNRRLPFDVFAMPMVVVCSRILCLRFHWSMIV